METYNPILKNYPFKKPGFLETFNITPPVAPFGVALVYAGQSEKFVLEPGNKLPRTILVQGKFHTVYEVDVNKRSFTFEDFFLSSYYLDKFQIKMRFTCYVSKPLKIIDNSTTDAAGCIEPLIANTVKEIAKNHDVMDYKKTENELIRTFNEEKFINELSETGFMVQDFYVEVKLSPEVEDRLRKDREQKEIRENKITEINNNTAVKMELFKVLVPLLKQDPELAEIFVTSDDNEIRGIVKNYQQSRNMDIQNKINLITQLNQHGISLSDVSELLGRTAKNDSSIFISVEQPKKITDGESRDGIEMYLENSKKTLDED